MVGGTKPQKKNLKPPRNFVVNYLRSLLDFSPRMLWIKSIPKAAKPGASNSPPHHALLDMSRVAIRGDRRS